MERGHRERASSRRGDGCPEASAGVLPSRQVESDPAPSCAPMLPIMPLGPEWAPNARPSVLPVGSAGSDTFRPPRTKRGRPQKSAKTSAPPERSVRAGTAGYIKPWQVPWMISARSCPRRVLGLGVLGLTPPCPCAPLTPRKSFKSASLCKLQAFN